jgi:hypothetical protein
MNSVLIGAISVYMWLTPAGDFAFTDDKALIPSGIDRTQVAEIAVDGLKGWKKFTPIRRLDATGGWVDPTDAEVKAVADSIVPQAVKATEDTRPPVSPSVTGKP